jgi:hypothetical protein
MAITEAHPSYPGLKKELRRLTLALQCFEGAQLLTDHLIKLGPNQNPRFYSACMTGIVVSYMRAFTASAGIGSLHKDYTIFSDLKLEETNRELELARHQFHAHYDLTRAELLKLEYEGPDSPYEITVRFRQGEDGKMRIFPTVAVPEITSASLPEIHALLEFQMQRLLKGLARVLKAMGEGNTYDADTKYTVGKNFP